MAHESVLEEMDPTQCVDNAEPNSYVVVSETDTYHYSRDALVSLQCEDDQFGFNAVMVTEEGTFSLRRCTPFISYNRNTGSGGSRRTIFSKLHSKTFSPCASTSYHSYCEQLSHSRSRVWLTTTSFRDFWSSFQSLAAENWKERRPKEELALGVTRDIPAGTRATDMEPSGLIERWHEEPNTVDDDKQDREEY